MTSLHGKPNRQAIAQELEQASARVRQTRMEIEHHRQHGDYRSERRANARLDQWEARETELFGLLNPLFINGVSDVERPHKCAYCDFRMTPDENWKWGGLCPRCDPSKPEGLDPRHPLWSPLLDGGDRNRSNT